MHRDHEYIQILAYRIWEARGRPEGSANQDWLEAERQLAAADAAGAAPSAAASAMPDTQMNTMNTAQTKLRATATVRAPATPRVSPAARTSAPVPDSDHAGKKQGPGWPGSS
jgi:hypothetical protein